MSRRILFISILLASFLALALLLFQKKPQIKQIQDHQKINISINNKKLEVEVVNTPESIAQGLSGREGIGSDGMLFVFPDKHIPKFWMKDMKFNLDFVWISDNRVIDISENIPKPDLEANYHELPSFAPKYPADKVLEIEAGKVEDWEIEIEDKVSFL